MPNVNDIATLAEALEKQHVIVVGDRCAAVRNRNSTCRRCVEACAFGALKVEANEVHFDSTSCVGCGACIGTCPTEALVFADAPDTAIVDQAAQAIEAADGIAVVACARISSKRLADPQKYVEVPCIARIDETLLVRIAAQGCASIALVDGNCETCKYRSCTHGVDIAVEQAASTLETSGGSCAIERMSSFPESTLVEDATGMFGSTRRGFLSDAVGAARETAMTAARTTIEQELGLKVQEAAIGERLRVTAGGSLPTVSTPRHDAFLNAFDALGEPAGDYLASRRFATIRIVPDRCNSCGMCAVFCPTGALKRNPAEKASDPVEYVEFSASECVNCNLCKDVCWKGALEIEEGVSIDQLYDFDPRHYDLPKLGKRSPFGRSSF